MNRRALLKTIGGGFLAGSPQWRTRRKTSVTMEGDRFLINGRLAYAGRTWRGMRIEGLLINSRMVQGIFDDLNPETQGRWAYPDTKQTAEVPSSHPMRPDGK